MRFSFDYSRRQQSAYRVRPRGWRACGCSAHVKGRRATIYDAIAPPDQQITRKSERRLSRSFADPLLTRLSTTNPHRHSLTPVRKLSGAQQAVRSTRGSVSVEAVAMEVSDFACRHSPPRLDVS